MVVNYQILRKKVKQLAVNKEGNFIDENEERYYNDVDDLGIEEDNGEEELKGEENAIQ